MRPALASAGMGHAAGVYVASFDRRQSRVVASLDRRRTYVDVLERVLGTSSRPTGLGTRSRICHFTVGELRSTVSLTVLDHTHRDLDNF